MKLLDGRTAVVTGGAQGLGLAIARTFVAHGARVVLGDVNLEQAESAAESIRADGGQAVAVRCDVTAQPDVEGLVRRAVDDYGRLDIMVNNAGILRDAVMRKMSLDDFRLVLDVHLTGCWLGTRTAGAVMREQGKGSIINMSSMSGKNGNPGQTNYSAAKAGIVGLTKAAAKELARYNIRVNALQPGLIYTPMTAAMPKDAYEALLATIPMGRAGTPDEVAGGALFLASDLAGFVTGTTLEISGGRGI